MKKIIFCILCIFFFVGLFSCSNVSQDDIIYDKSSSRHADWKNKIIKGDEPSIVIYITSGTGSLDLKIISLDKKEDAIVVKIDCDIPYVCTTDMAYWKITIKSTNEYLEGINKLEFDVGKLYKYIMPASETILV